MHYEVCNMLSRFTNITYITCQRNKALDSKRTVRRIVASGLKLTPSRTSLAKCTENKRWEGLNEVITPSSASICFSRSLQQKLRPDPIALVNMSRYQVLCWFDVANRSRSGIPCRVGWFRAVRFFQLGLLLAESSSSKLYIWLNYNDLTATSLKWWFAGETILA